MKAQRIHMRDEQGGRLLAYRVDSDDGTLCANVHVDARVVRLAIEAEDTARYNALPYAARAAGVHLERSPSGWQWLMLQRCEQAALAQARAMGLHT